MGRCKGAGDHKGRWLCKGCAAPHVGEVARAQLPNGVRCYQQKGVVLQRCAASIGLLLSAAFVYLAHTAVGERQRKAESLLAASLFFTLCHVAATNGKLPHEVESAAEREAATAEAQAAAADEAAALSGIPAPNAPWADLQALMQQTLAEIKGSGRAGWTDGRRCAAVDRRCGAWQLGKTKEQQKSINGFKIKFRIEMA